MLRAVPIRIALSCRRTFWSQSVYRAESLAAIAGPSSRRGNPPRLGVRTPDQAEEDLPSLLKVLLSFKNQSRQPTDTAYHAILRCVSDYVLQRGGTGGRSGATYEETLLEDTEARPEGLGWQIAICALRDAEIGGFDLGTEGIEQLMRLSAAYPHLIPSLLLELSATSTQPTPSIYNAVARVAVSASNLEQLVLITHEMLERDVLPPTAMFKHFVRLACEWGCPRLAMQTAERVESRSSEGLRLDTAIWIQILIGSIENQFLSGVITAWDRAVQSRIYTPDEGLVLRVLDVAARWGRPDLATKALDILPDLGVRPQEFHLVPLLEAYVTAGQTPDAIKVLSSIRSAGMTPSMVTAEPIVAALVNVDLIDQAFYAIEDMHKSGEAVDIVALNAVIDASVRLGDLQRVRATQAAATDLGLIPNLDTFNIVLSGCLRARHGPLGSSVLSEMAELSIAPDATTYQRMILLCLSQQTYEDAFYYLEKMKADDIRPPAGVYQALIRRCVDAEDIRWRLVKEEMELLGYRVDERLHQRLNRSQGVSEFGNSARRRGEYHAASRQEEQDEGGSDSKSTAILTGTT